MKQSLFAKSAQQLTLALLFIVSLSCTTPSSIKKDTDHQSGWKKLGPGGGGSTFLPIFSHDHADHFIVRCDMTGTYVTTDGGQSYRQFNFANGTSSYAYDPTEVSTVYAANNALHRSRDGGANWEQLFPKPEDVTEARYLGDHANFRMVVKDGTLYPSDASHINSLVVDPSDGGRSLHFSMGRYFFSSKDSGANWERIETSSEIMGLYTDDTHARDYVYIFGKATLTRYDKRDLSVSTTELPKEMQPAFSFSAGTITGTGDLIIYALHNKDDDDPTDEFGETQLWISRDNGSTWKHTSDAVISSNGSNPSYSMIACAANDAANAYLVSNRYLEKKADGSDVYWYGALKTSTAGSEWHWVWKGGGGSGRYGVKDGQGVANLTDAWTEEAFGGEYIRLLDAGVFANDGNIAVVTDWYRTMKTTDGGKTWKEVYSVEQPDGSFVSRGMDVTTAYGLHFDPFDKNHIVISYTDIGFHHSYNNGESWSRSVEGVPSDWVNTSYWVVFDPEVNGKLWSVWSSLHDFPRGKMTRNPRWKRYARGGVCVSLDGGKTWAPTSEDMGPDAPATSIVLDPKSPAGQRTLYASVYTKGIFKSTDDGKTWTLKNKGIGDNTAAFELTLSPNGDLFAVISPTPAHTDGKAGLDFFSGEVYRSRDGAETWTKLNVADGLLFPSGIAVDPENPNRVYLGCWGNITLSDLVGGGVVRQFGAENKILDMPGGIFLSEDGGDTWSSIFDRNQYVYDVTIDQRHPGRLYCNTFNKVAWRSDDFGKTWRELKDYDFHWGHRVVVDENDPEKVYLTTYGSSVWHGAPVVAE